MTLINLSATAGNVDLLITMNTGTCAWQCFNNGHFVTDLNQNGGQPDFPISLGSPSTIGPGAIAFLLTNTGAAPVPYSIDLQWKQAGQVIRQESLTGSASPVNAAGVGCWVSEMFIYHVLPVASIV